MNYAGFVPRLGGAILDTIFMLLLMLIPGALIAAAFLIFRDNTLLMGLLSLVGYVLMFVISWGYQLYFIGTKGATPGKKIMHLRVTRPDGTYPIGVGKAFVRMIGYMVSAIICYIGFLMIIFDKEQHRGLHDKIAGTVVIKEA